METVKVDTEPGALVVGGCGVIGWDLVEHLLDNELVSYLRVVDKVPPQTAWLNKKLHKVFKHPLLEFRSANLINQVYPIFHIPFAFWMMKNSWGPMWDQQGYYRVHRGNGTCRVNQMAPNAIVASRPFNC